MEPNFERRDLTSRPGSPMAKINSIIAENRFYAALYAGLHLAALEAKNRQSENELRELRNKMAKGSALFWYKAAIVAVVFLVVYTQFLKWTWGVK